MFDDVLKTIKAQLYEKVSSLLLASFILSWVAWEYRFVVVIISSMTAPEKMQYVDDHLYQTIREIVLRSALYPLLTMLFLIFVYPIPARYVYDLPLLKQGPFTPDALTQKVREVLDREENALP